MLLFRQERTTEKVNTTMERKTELPNFNAGGMFTYHLAVECLLSFR